MLHLAFLRCERDKLVPSLGVAMRGGLVQKVPCRSCAQGKCMSPSLSSAAPREDFLLQGGGDSDHWVRETPKF